MFIRLQRLLLIVHNAIAHRNSINATEIMTRKYQPDPKKVEIAKRQIREDKKAFSAASDSDAVGQSDGRKTEALQATEIKG